MENFNWAVKEMKAGKFVRCKNWIKGLYYFMQDKELIGENPNFRVSLVNIEQRNYKAIETTAYFLSDFEAENWISKTKNQIKKENHRFLNKEIK